MVFFVSLCFVCCFFCVFFLVVVLDHIQYLNIFLRRGLHPSQCRYVPWVRPRYACSQTAAVASGVTLDLTDPQYDAAASATFKGRYLANTCRRLATRTGKRRVRKRTYTTHVTHTEQHDEGNENNHKVASHGRRCIFAGCKGRFLFCFIVVIFSMF